MIEYIIKILSIYMQDTILNTTIYNMLKDVNVRRNIVCDVRSDKFVIPVHKIVEQYPNAELIDFSKISSYKQQIKETNVYIRVYQDVFSFWLE